MRGDSSVGEVIKESESRTSRRADILRSKDISHQYGEDSFSVAFHTLPTLMQYEIVAILDFSSLSNYLTGFNQKFNPRGKKSFQLGLLKCLHYCEKFWLQ